MTQQQKTPAQIAARLIANGYRPVPCEGKRAKGLDWPNFDFAPTDFALKHNVGIKTGQGIAFVDIDVTNPEASAAIVVEWLRRHPGGLRRTGLAPKTGFLVASDFARKEEVKLPELGEKDKVEILTNGQQFIAYGLHPDTGKPYHWHDHAPLDDFLGVKDALLVVSEAEIRDFLIWVAERYVSKKTGPKLSEQATPRAGSYEITRDSAAEQTASLAEVQEILSYIPSDCGYADWLAVLMGLHEWSGGSQHGLSVADTWSAQGAKYKPGEVSGKWKGFATGGGTKWATVPAFARANGADLSAIARKYKGRGNTAPSGRPSASQGQEPEPDADPVDLWGTFDPPELPKGLLPPIIEEFALIKGAQMGADPAGLAIAALVTCAAAIPDRVQIKVKRHDDWKESARLWAALVGLPSAKKTPIISAATGPLCLIDVQMMRDWKQRVARYDALTPEEKKGKQRPLQTRQRIEDATVEAAQQVLEGSPWGVLLLQDELSGFFGAMDRYGGGKGAQADRAFWLRSFNGGQFALNRVARGAAIIENLSVSMLGGIQPEPLRKVAGDSVDDGLLQRLFPIMLRNASVSKDEPMPPINDRYARLVEALHKLQPPGWVGAGVLEFDEGAQAIRRDLEARHLKLQSLETINRKLASHIGKYDGLFARLCVVWHCVEYVENTILCPEPAFGGDEGLPATVTEATAQRVADFLHRFLLAHSIAFYSGVLGLSDDHDRLTAIAGYILAHRLERVTNRDVQRGDRTMRGLKEFEIRPLLEQLASLGWLDRLEGPRPSAPPHWQVNPKVHAKFATRGLRELDRRNEARATIQSLARASE